MCDKRAIHDQLKTMLILSIAALLGRMVSNLVYFFTYMYDAEQQRFFLQSSSPRPTGWIFMGLFLLPCVILLVYALGGYRRKSAAVLRLCVLGAIAVLFLISGAYNLILVPSVWQNGHTIANIQYVLSAMLMLGIGIVFAVATVGVIRKPANYGGVFAICAYPGWLLASLDIPTFLMNIRFYWAWKQYLTLLTSAAHTLFLVALFAAIWLIGKQGQGAVSESCS